MNISLKQFWDKLLSFFFNKNSVTDDLNNKARIIGVAMVKNEADIIELFIKINCRFFTEIHILDHLSSDHTAAIIKKCQAWGYPVKYKLLEHDGSGYNQAEITTHYVQLVARDCECDYIMPIDADEFPCMGSAQKIGKILSEATSACGYCLIPWVTYCPINEDYLSSQAPLYTNFRSRNHEPEQYYKVILTRDFAKNVKLTAGNHSVVEEKKYRPRKIKAILQHVPVRSAAQISSKAIIGSATLKITKNHKKGESFHWDEMAERILQKNMEISKAETLDIALNYAKLKKQKRSPKISRLPWRPRIGTPLDSIELKDLARVDLEKNLENFKAMLAATPKIN